MIAQFQSGPVSTLRQIPQATCQLGRDGHQL